MKQHESACVSLWQLIGPSNGHVDARLVGGYSVEATVSLDCELGLASYALKMSSGLEMESPARF